MVFWELNRKFSCRYFSKNVHRLEFIICMNFKSIWGRYQFNSLLNNRFINDKYLDYVDK